MFVWLFVWLFVCFAGHCLRLLRVINSDRRLSSFMAPEGISWCSLNHNAKIRNILPRYPVFPDFVRHFPRLCSSPLGGKVGGLYLGTDYTDYTAF